MKLLDCTVQLGGTKTHSVAKHKISELELKLLKHIHGSEAITDLRQVGEIEVNKDKEYRNLARFYGASAVEKCFDIELSDFSAWLEEQLEAEEAKRYEKKMYDADVAPEKPVKAAKKTKQTVVENDDDDDEPPMFDGNGDPINPEPAPEETSATSDAETAAKLNPPAPQGLE